MKENNENQGQYYDVLVSVKVFARVYAESADEAISMANEMGAGELFPNDIAADDITSIEATGTVYEADDED